jgi:hypothetical protein
MRSLRLVALIIGVALMPFAIHFALAKSEENAVKETPAASTSAGKACLAQHPKPTVENFVEGMANAAFARLDADKDGRISHDEFMSPYEKEFKETDANNDGFWTKEEYTCIRVKKMQEKRKK